MPRKASVETKLRRARAELNALKRAHRVLHGKLDRCVVVGPQIRPAGGRSASVCGPKRRRVDGFGVVLRVVSPVSEDVPVRDGDEEDSFLLLPPVDLWDETEDLP